MKRRICLLFSGQSVQEPGMGRGLWALPRAKETLERLRRPLGGDLEHLLNDMPADELRRTFNAQRAIHAHHLACWAAFSAAHPEAALSGAIGHSVGIAAALVAAGAFSIEDSAVFVRERAKAFSEVCASLQEPHGLLGVSSEDIDELRDRIDAFPGVVLALRNTVGKGVLGGRLADLEAFSETAEREGWPLRTQPLRVEGPYHTPAFSPARDRLRKALESITVRPPRVPVFMGTSGRMETEPERIKELLAEQAVSCERHLDAVRAAYRRCCREFLEVGFKPQPIHWIKDQLTDSEGNLLSGVAICSVGIEELLEPFSFDSAPGGRSSRL